MPPAVAKLAVPKVAWHAAADDPARPAADAAAREADPPADGPLLPRVALREAGSVEACIDRYGGAVVNLARRLCRQPGDVDDAVQEIFVELWRHAGRFDAAAGGEWTFVLTIARRRLIDRVRRASRRGREVPWHGREGRDGPSAAPGANLTHDAAGPREQAEFGEQAAAAVAALDRLSDDQQTVLRLSLFEGMSYPEIGSRLSMPLGTVKTHARRGLIRLRQLLDSDGE